MRGVAAPKRELLLVLGMHRSGTSALAGMLEKVGAVLGEDLMPPTADNPKGYFENTRVVAAHEHLFDALAMAWDDPRPMPSDWNEGPVAEHVREALADVVRTLAANDSTVVVKDPRSSRTMPLWLDAARSADTRPGALLMVRHPDEVAASLQRRDGLSRPRAHLLWLRYMLEAERATRGVPRVFVAYEAVLRDWRAELARIRERGLGLALRPSAAAEAEVDAFLDGSLRNHRSAPEDWEASSFCAPLAAELHALLLRGAEGAEPDVAAFDDIARRFDAASAGYFAAVDDAAARDVPFLLEREIHRQGLDKSRVDTSLQLAALLELWRPLTPLREPGRCRLYYREATTSFVEAYTVWADAVSCGDGRCAEFVLPAGARPDFLRIDPDDAPGVYSVLSLAIGGTQVDDLPERVGAISEMQLHADSPGVALRLAALGDDPYFEVDVRGLPQQVGDDGRARVEIRFRLETLATGFDERLHALMASGEAGREALRAQVSMVGEAQAALAASLDTLRDALGESGRLQEEIRAATARDHALAAELMTLRAQQAELLAWARRRSSAHWWRHFRGLLARRVPIDLALIPAGDARREADGADAAWVCEGGDPRFMLDSRDRTLDGGWYLLEADLTDLDGPLVAPCLYPDYGDGIYESERLPLPEPDADGRLRAVIRLKGPVTALRFDPSTRNTRFRLPGLRLRRLGRGRALATMARLAGQNGGPRPWRQRFDMLRVVAKAAFARGLRHGGDVAYARYTAATLPEGDDYAAWVRDHDTLDAAAIERLRGTVDALSARPLVSILLPVYRTPERWLRRCLDSVLAQVYPDWELCVADDASASPQVRSVLEEYARRDPRIRVTFRERNGHISAATNTALEMARGDYVALLDHDDELRPHALLEMVAALGANPRWRLVYSDEDKISGKGERFDPYFKPDWNYELLLAQNCICHLGVYDTALVREVGGFREGFEGAQDWDLALRCVERLRPDEIGHVPKVLYHWRAIAGSTALGLDHKDYAGGAGMRAVEEHLERTGQRARVRANRAGHLEVHRAVPSPAPRVSLIIPTRDRVELLRTCVRSILDRTDYPDYEILVVDNQSSEPATLEYFRSLEAEPRVRVLAYDAPFNYSRINNFAAEQATGAIIGLVNNDIETIGPEWLGEMVGQVVRPEIGAVGAMLRYPDDTIQHAGVVLGIGSVAGHAYTGRPAGYEGQCGRALVAQEVSAVTAACLLVRKEVWDEVGGLDERLVVAFNDIDFCLRLLDAGYRNVWTPYATLYHHESASRGYEDTPEKMARFQGEVAIMRARWGDALLHDPAYNPNLTLTGAPFELAFPPRAPRPGPGPVPGRPGQWRRDGARPASG
nr:glycosyltransferase [Luteimonas granuli]